MKKRILSCLALCSLILLTCASCGKELSVTEVENQNSQIKVENQNSQIKYEENENFLSVKLTSEQQESLECAYYTVFEKDEEMGYVPILMECSVVPDDKGIIQIEKEQEAFVLRNPDGEDILWNFQQEEKTEEMTIWKSTNYFVSETSSSFFTNGDTERMLVEIKEESNGLSLLAFDMEDKGFVLWEEKREILNNWNYVMFSGRSYEPCYDSENNLLDYTKWTPDWIYSIVERYEKAGEEATFEKIPLSEVNVDIYCQLVLEMQDGIIVASDLMLLVEKEEKEDTEYTMATEQGLLTYQKVEDGIEITDYEGEDEEIILPEKIEDTEIVSIGEGAFGSNESLRVVSLPEGVKRIREKAFAYCTALEQIELPPTVVYVGEGVFSHDTALSCINLSEENSNYQVEDGMLLTADGKKLFGACLAGRDTCEIPAGVEEIENFAFAGASDLKQVSFPDSLRKIDCGAFIDASWLEITLPESLEYIGSNAFGEFLSYDPDKTYVSQSVVRIGKNVSWIGEDAFRGHLIQNFDVDEANSMYASLDGVIYAKEKTVLVECPTGKQGVLKIPDGVLEIDMDAFYNNGELCPVGMEEEDTSGITELILSDSVKKLYGGSLPTDTTSVYIGSGLESWSGLTDYVYLENLEISSENENFTIEDGVIYNKDKTSLLLYMADKADEHFDIPETVNTIDEYAFGYSGYLRSVSIPDSVGIEESLSGSMYGLNRIDTLEEVYVSEDHPSMAVEDGVLYDKNKEILLVYPSGKEDSEYAVIEGVKQIKDTAFSSAYNIYTLILPSSLCVVDNLKDILDSLYYLESVQVEGDNPYVNVQDGLVYTEFNGQKSVIFALSDTPPIVNLEEGTVTIGESVFSGLSYNSVITEVHIPEGVKTIGSYNFNRISGMDEWDVIHVYLPDSLEKINSSSFENSPGVVIHASENSYGAQFANEHGLTLEIESI